MNRAEYLNRVSVQGFVEWIGERLDQPGSLPHQYTHSKSKQLWHCDSLYSAFKNYEWKSKGYDETQRVLGDLSDGLRYSIDIKDEIEAKRHALAVLSWGGVLNGNNVRINNYGDGLTAYLKKAITLLDLHNADIETNFDGIISNSGFTKIYSLVIDDFIIYDSRVAAALGMLVLIYCQEKQMDFIPEELRFAYGGGRKGNSAFDRRNPGYGRLTFPQLNGSHTTHVINNIKANWLLKEVVDKADSKFLNLREIEAALFMIGYDVQYAKLFSPTHC